MRFSSLSRALVGLGLAGFCAVTVAAQTAEYVLGPQDIFSITIFGPGGVSERYTVETDGTFIFPMLGRMKAAGLSAKKLQEELTNRLRDGYFKDPRVVVTIEDFKSQRIFVVGEVKNPGTYSLTRPLTLVEALALAGSPTPTAGTVALVRRRSDGQPSTTPVTQAGEGVTEIRADLAALQEGVVSENPTLRDGDTIAVPRIAPVYVFGHVNRPGEYPVAKDATVRQVLSLAGGVSQRGAAGRMKIIRIVAGVEQEFKVELDDRVKPGDTLVIPERFF
jgi:polysaccharide export outer membrane protein